MAKALKEAFGSGESFDIKGLTQCLKQNDCNVPNIDMKKHGAIGRFRMCVGLMLRAALKQTGSLAIAGKQFGTTRRKRKGRITKV